MFWFLIICGLVGLCFADNGRHASTAQDAIDDQYFRDQRSAARKQILNWMLRRS